MTGPAAETALERKEKRAVKKSELLAPAGNLEKLKVAVLYGADAVYLAGREYGLRSNADNFSLEEMREGVRFARQHGAKVYVAANIYAHNENIPGLEDYLRAVEEAGVDGVIVADPLVIETCKKAAPALEIHLSTQQSLSNWKAVQFWKEEGLDRVVLARETSAEEIRLIKEKVDIEIETFIHGAMCIAYSGRCVLSNHMTARDSNRGGCCQSCRWDYDLYRLEGENEVLLFSEGDPPFSMSAKDLRLVEAIPKIIDLGIDSLKIEGRMKSVHYVGTVTNVYRQVIDRYCEDPENFRLEKRWLDELEKCANRETAPAFFEGFPDYRQQLFKNHSKKPSHQFVGMVLGYDPETGTATVQQRNFFQTGDRLEFFGPGMKHFTMELGELTDEEGNRIEAARHPLEIVKIKVDHPVEPYYMIRKEN